MKAKVKVAFDGCIDGSPVPRKIEVGEEIQGDLARVAVEQKWAVEVLEEPADTPEKPLSKMNVEQLKAKASELGVDLDAAQTKAEIIAAIEEAAA